MIRHTRNALEKWPGSERSHKIRTARELLVCSLATRYVGLVGESGKSGKSGTGVDPWRQQLV